MLVNFQIILFDDWRDAKIKALLIMFPFKFEEYFSVFVYLKQLFPPA